MGAPWVVTVTTAGVLVVVERVTTRQRTTVRPLTTARETIVPRAHPRAATCTRRFTTRLVATRFGLAE